MTTLTIIGERGLRNVDNYHNFLRTENESKSQTMVFLFLISDPFCDSKDFSFHEFVLCIVPKHFTIPKGSQGVMIGIITRENAYIF